MKLKILFSSLVLAMLSTLFYGCKKSFLDTLPKASANEILLATEEGVNALLIGAYAALDGHTMGDDWTSQGGAVTNWVWGNVASDDATKGSDLSDQGQIVPIENYSVVANNGYVANKWFANYNGISRANDVLKVMAKCDPALPDATQASIRAQALFIRGFIHFELKRVFNNIPYITEDVDPVTVRNDVDAWPKIEADLEYAVANLPASQPEVGRITKYAAEAVLARVYMFQKKWLEAQTLLDDIITSGKYQLMPRFGDNFTIANRNNIESILEIQYSVNDASGGSFNAGYGDVLNFPIDVDGTGTCCGFHQPTQNLVNAFQVDASGLPILSGTPPNFKNDMNILSSSAFVQDTTTLVDPRLDLTVGRRGVPYLDWGIMRGSEWIRDQNNGGPYLNKKNMFLKTEKGKLSTSDSWALGLSANNYRAIRYSHILLWRAEVAIESPSPDFAYATLLVNQIRERANNQKVMGRCRTFILPNQTDLDVDYTVPAANYLVNPYSSTFPSLDYARKAVRTEMRLEFAMEGLRHFDLVRWGIAAATINAYLEQDRAFRPLFGGSIPAVFTEGKNEYWPIPQVQLDLQKQVLTQNPNY
jgi:hypothetical protein